MQRRIALVAALLAAAGVSVVGIASAGNAAPDGQQVVTPFKVTVTMRDFRFVMSTKTVPRNRPVVFTVINRGPSPHDFDVSGTKGTPVIAVGKRVTQRVTFRKAGRYRYVCTVPRHAQFGMFGNLTVKA